MQRERPSLDDDVQPPLKKHRTQPSRYTLEVHKESFRGKIVMRHIEASVSKTELVLNTGQKVDVSDPAEYGMVKRPARYVKQSSSYKDIDRQICLQHARYLH